MDADQAVSLALRFVDGMRDTAVPGSASEARAFVEHLAAHGYLVRARDKGEWRRDQPSTLERRQVSPDEIRSMREARKLSLASLAKMAGISANALGRIERSRTIPRSRTLEAVLDALDRAKSGASVEEG